MRHLPIKDNPEDHPPKTSKADKAYILAKAAISAIPLVGGPGAELLALLLAPPMEARRDAWFESIAFRLRALQDALPGFRIEALKDNPLFVSTMIQATQAAIRTHQKEKLDALRNAVLNVASGHTPPHDLSEIFLVLIDSLTKQHLLILQLIANGRYVYTEDYPLLNDSELANQIATDLASRGLITGRHQKASAELVDHGRYAPDIQLKEGRTVYIDCFGGMSSVPARLTTLGTKFFAFITEQPASPAG